MTSTAWSNPLNEAGPRSTKVIPASGRLGRADDRPGDQYLSGTGVRTQSSRRVQGNASVPVLDGHGLARVDADPDRQGERGVGLALLGAGGLELDGGTHRL
jgi:hypothetical protein